MTQRSVCIVSNVFEPLYTVNIELTKSSLSKSLCGICFRIREAWLEFPGSVTTICISLDNFCKLQLLYVENE